ncbi:type II toxin-antitoxin system RelE/ParE family toxin [Methylobacterium sp. W2]|uniref:type II toxin-antitoxin system RelE/ParE family toxin n=1 Tax=Methylobacterium sp. W2 TaxID=2598107 RepID=UPI001D0C3982|nr:type II toxin-antitoxin system RelE/ParE family toxin [Methylobacterium sp. W2]MCC0806278.1 type II toxin-antitoxin system RelE/ParE family toxin [Methylobacterium sp. W2]
MKLLVSATAMRRLREIAEHIHERHPAAARSVGRTIEDAFDLVARYPEMGRRLPKRVRRFATPCKPYFISNQVSQK